MAINLDVALVNLAISVVINVVVLSPVLWISGRLVAGKDNEVHGCSVDSVVVGTVIGSVFG